MQAPEPETSREVRRVINAIHDLSELEAQIPLCKTIDEVEDIRARCNGIQSIDRELLGPSLVAWARRVATLCQLRITELQVLAIAKRKKNSGDSLTPFEKEILERITNNSDSLMTSDEELDAGHPVRAYHKWWEAQLVRDPMPRDLNAKIGNGLIRAWSAFRRNEQIDKLRPPTTAPEII